MPDFLIVGMLAALLTTPVSAVGSDFSRTATLFAQSQPSQPPQQQDEFVPVSELPPQDQLPAAPLLISAYTFVWVALFGYVFSVARRLNGVQREVTRLEGDMKRERRA